MLNVRVIQDLKAVVMSPETFNLLSLSGLQLPFQFGQRRKTLPIRLDSSLPINSIQIDNHIDSKIKMPNLPYKGNIQNQVLNIGPVIGFFNKRSLVDYPQRILTRFSDYQNLGGLIFIFGRGDVDIKRQRIHGKYFDPATKDFVKTVLPYPASIYLRAFLPKDLYRSLKKNLGPAKIFNYPYASNKQSFWEAVRGDLKVATHLPETQILSLGNLLSMLAKYPGIYLKPTNLSQGRGIYHVSKLGNDFRIKDTKGKTITGDEGILNRFITELSLPYLCQQEIYFYHQERKVDFRIYLQKDSSMEWKCKCTDAKISIPGSIISNRCNRRIEAIPGENGMRMYFGMNNDQIQGKIQETAQLCIHALQLMEKRGHSLGDVAVDFLLDSQLKVWLLEVQPDYFANVFARQYMPSLVHPAPLEYAKALAGFKD